MTLLLFYPSSWGRFLVADVVLVMRHFWMRFVVFCEKSWFPRSLLISKQPPWVSNRYSSLLQSVSAKLIAAKITIEMSYVTQRTSFISIVSQMSRFCSKRMVFKHLASIASIPATANSFNRHLTDIHPIASEKPPLANQHITHRPPCSLHFCLFCHSFHSQ